MVKKNKTKIRFVLAGLFQIFLLANMVAAQSYNIHQFNPAEEVVKEEGGNLFGKLLKLFFSIKQIGIVSAKDNNDTWKKFNVTGSASSEFSLSDVTWNCCPLMNDGSICQDIASITPELCAVNPVPTKCEQLSSCKIGCCIDEEEGLCTTKSPMQKCESDRGKWNENANCLIHECQKGCCVLGGEVQFATEKRCEKLSLLHGIEKDFRDLETEPECLVLKASQFSGACIVSGTCSMKTESECLSSRGMFHHDYLCSHPSLETGCEKQTSVGCVDSKDEIYWFDSCGNQENIYSSNKDASWNNGIILSKEESCGANLANVDSESCGNCNYYLGSTCSESTGVKIVGGDFVCKDLRCRYKDEWGKNIVRQNGESWCVYDGYIGDGKDTAGSRHWRRMCVEGEIKVEPCADYRGAICAETEIKEGGKTFTNSACVVNDAIRCITGDTECSENKDCMIKNINVDAHFQFDICVGRYPRGFDLTGDRSSAKQLCSMASQKCTVYYVKDWDGNWNCAANCACETAEFARQMNDLCVSLGDCGSYINYIGEGTKNSATTGAPGVSWTDYKSYAKPVEGQFAEPRDMQEFLGSMSGASGEYVPEGESGFAKNIKLAGTISGGLGTLVGAAIGLGKILPASVVIELHPLNFGMLEAFAYAAAGAAIGAMIGAYFAQELGRTGDAAMVMALAGGVVGATAGLMIAGFIESGLWTAGFWVIVVAVIIMIYIWLSGWGKTSQRIVEFQCMPWQPPVGGDDCHKCDDDSMKPCSKYRCDSLGKACKLLNENTENPLCESIPYEPNPPVISTLNINAGYEFFNKETKRVEIRQDTSECIPEFTSVLFSLKTDEASQCKLEFQRTNTYEEMTNYPMEQTLFTRNHSFAFSMPSLDSLEVYGLTGDLKEMFGNMNMYVRCQDYHGNFNIDEYVVNFCINSGPDLTPARIVQSNPANEDYLKYGASETNWTIHLNEPAECKYDIVAEKEYGAMDYTMVCDTGIFNSTMYGWPCSTILTNLSDVNTYYIKCKDKPWVQTPEDVEKYLERNVNNQDFVYSLYLTETELVIKDVSPAGVIEGGFEPMSVDLEIATSGGMNNGVSLCYYKLASDWIAFFNTYSNLHSQTFDAMMRGSYNISLMCKDDAGNVDYANSTFILKIDTAGPQVIRLYKSGANLKLVTDEEASCYYNFNRCNFDINNATSMTTALSRDHYVEWTEGQTYYVKCEDIWGNVNPDCAIIIKPSRL